MAKKKEGKQPKVVAKVRKVTGKSVVVEQDSEPKAAVVKLTTKAKPKQTVYVSNEPGKRELRLHRTEADAVNRFRRFPRITPVLHKKL